MMSDVVYVGLGSNMDNPQEQLQEAVKHIHNHEQVSVQTCSFLYESSPMGPQNQSNFINAVCQLNTSLTPIELLDFLQSVEQLHGRTRVGERWGPRTLDLDILLFNNLRMDNDRLTLPHYGMADREFVLVPLFEIAPDLIMQDGRRISVWVKECTLDGLKRLPIKLKTGEFSFQ